MEKKAEVELHLERATGGLKELVLRWFTETQASLILHNGNFPDWFQGFSARKDTEDLLRDKALGCFLIRLSDKVIGYILSYRGHDRCRHFVITQNQEGQFVLAGDYQTYGSLTELIEFYKASPIQPFGECLTSSCYQVSTGELYDVVSYRTKETSGVSVQALRTLWDQKKDQHSEGVNHKINHKSQQHSDLTAMLRPELPLKNRNRKLTGAVSVDTMSLSQGVPPIPKRGQPLAFSLSESLPGTLLHQMLSNRPERLQGGPSLNSVNSSDSSHPDDLCLPEPTQVESTGQPLIKLSSREEGEEEEEEEEEYSNRINSSAFSSSSSSPLKKVTCHTYSVHESSTSDLEVVRSNPLYQVSMPRAAETMTPAGPEDTYEQIPGGDVTLQGNTYESLEDINTKKPKSTWGKKNMKWKKFLPDNKKK